MRLLHKELGHRVHVERLVFQKNLATLGNTWGREQTAGNSLRFKIASRTISVILGEKSSRQMARTVFVFSKCHTIHTPTCKQIEEGLHEEIGEPPKE